MEYNIKEWAIFFFTNSLFFVQSNQKHASTCFTISPIMGLDYNGYALKLFYCLEIIVYYYYRVNLLFGVCESNKNVVPK